MATPLVTNCVPVRGSMIGVATPEKSPLRCAAVSDWIVTELGDERCCVPWYEKKKNARFFTIGPPTVPPY